LKLRTFTGGKPDSLANRGRFNRDDVICRRAFIDGRASCIILKPPKSIKPLTYPSFTANFDFDSGKLTWFCAGVACRRQNQNV
jgi:hypothetical protein